MDAKQDKDSGSDGTNCFSVDRNVRGFDPLQNDAHAGKIDRDRSERRLVFCRERTALELLLLVRLIEPVQGTEYQFVGIFIFGTEQAEGRFGNKVRIQLIAEVIIVSAEIVFRVVKSGNKSVHVFH